MMKQKLLSFLLSIASTCTGKFFLYITRNEHNASGRTAVKDSYGVWHVGDVYGKEDITYGIAQNGTVEKHETGLVHFILTRLRKSGNIVFHDIGANIGYYGLIAGTVFDAEVHSFEPTPEYAHNIRSAAELNHITDHLTVHECALSNSRGESIFYQSGSGSSLESDFNQTPDLPTLRIHTTTLDHEVEHKTVLPPTFIKLDVEGHEWAVLEGARQVISTYHPILFIELCTTLHDIGRDYVNPHYKKTLELLEELDYTLFLSTPEGTLKAWNTEMAIGHAGMFLCMHTNTHAKLLEEIRHAYTIE